MKRFVVDVVVLLLALSLAACNASGQTNSATPTGQAASVVTPAGQPAIEITPAGQAASEVTPVGQPKSVATYSPVPADQLKNVVTTASGLKYLDLVVGSGATPALTDWVTLHYTGTLEDGSTFDASRKNGAPLTGPLDELTKAVPGWGEGISTMKVGGTRLMIIPPSLAFGDKGAGNVIPPNATIMLTVDLLGTKPAPQVTITDTVVGTGVAATAGVTVSVNYTGKLQDGTVFDTSVGKQPFEFQLGAGQVIPGWDKGLVGMKVGGKRTLVIPPELAYGSQGAGNTIPPNATLTFDIELLAIK